MLAKPLCMLLILTSQNESQAFLAQQEIWEICWEKVLLLGGLEIVGGAFLTKENSATVVSQR